MIIADNRFPCFDYDATPLSYSSRDDDDDGEDDDDEDDEDDDDYDEVSN